MWTCDRLWTHKVNAEGSEQAQCLVTFHLLTRTVTCYHVCKLPVTAAKKSSVFTILLWLNCLSIVLQVQCPLTQYASAQCGFDYMWLKIIKYMGKNLQKLKYLNTHRETWAVTESTAEECQYQLQKQYINIWCPKMHLCGSEVGVHKHPFSCNPIFRIRSLYNTVLPNILWLLFLPVVSSFGCGRFYGACISWLA